ncbi:MAG: FkbM family methyltransferase [Sphingobacteriales bacterium]|nr:MAG: FkbM family methyltransferase [Sphingobacteriales bacterium]
MKKEIKIYNSHTHSSLYEIKGIDYAVQKTEIIELVKGDSFIEKHSIENIDFLKLDVEGAELDALKGFEKSLVNYKIRMIQFEYGYINITSKNLLTDYYDFFKKHNYIIGKIYPKHVQFRPYHFKQEDFIGPNYIAIHEADTELKNLLSNR